LCSGTRGGLGLASGLSCSLGGVLNGDTLSCPLSFAELGARESEALRDSVAGLPKALGFPALFTGGGICVAGDTLCENS
jgi:hypothetical protein